MQQPAPDDGTQASLQVLSIRFLYGDAGSGRRRRTRRDEEEEERGGGGGGGWRKQTLCLSTVVSTVATQTRYYSVAHATSLLQGRPSFGKTSEDPRPSTLSPNDRINIPGKRRVVVRLELEQLRDLKQVQLQVLVGDLLEQAHRVASHLQGNAKHWMKSTCFILDVLGTCS